MPVDLIEEQRVCLRKIKEDLDDLDDHFLVNIVNAIDDCYSNENYFESDPYKRKQAHELASLGDGDHVRPTHTSKCVEATIGEALKTRKTIKDGHSETPLCNANFAEAKPLGWGSS